MEPEVTSLGGRVRECREQLEWTQKELAGAASISVTFLSELENDHRTPGARVLLRLAEALGVSLDYLLRGAMGEGPKRRRLVLPVELAEVAEEQGWSVRVCSDQLAYRDMVVARRTRPGTAEHGEHRLTKGEWRRLHDWLAQSPIR